MWAYVHIGTSINAQYAHDAQYMPTEYCLKMPSDSSKRIYVTICKSCMTNQWAFLDLWELHRLASWEDLIYILYWFPWIYSCCSWSIYDFCGSYHCDYCGKKICKCKIWNVQGRQTRGCQWCTCTTTFSALPQKYIYE